MPHENACHFVIAIRHLCRLIGAEPADDSAYYALETLARAIRDRDQIEGPCTLAFDLEPGRLTGIATRGPRGELRDRAAFRADGSKVESLYESDADAASARDEGTREDTAGRD